VAIWELKRIETAARRFARALLERRSLVGSSIKVGDCRRTLTAPYAGQEQFRIQILGE